MRCREILPATLRALHRFVKLVQVSASAASRDQFKHHHGIVPSFVPTRALKADPITFAGNVGECLESAEAHSRSSATNENEGGTESFPALPTGLRLTRPRAPKFKVALQAHLPVRECLLTTQSAHWRNWSNEPSHSLSPAPHKEGQRCG